MFALRRDQHDDLEKVARTIGSDEEPTVGIFSSIFDGQGMFSRVADVFVGDAMSARRVVNIHTLIVVRKAGNNSFLARTTVGDDRRG